MRSFSCKMVLRIKFNYITYFYYTQQKKNFQYLVVHFSESNFSFSYAKTVQITLHRLDLLFCFGSADFFRSAKLSIFKKRKYFRFLKAITPAKTIRSAYRKRCE